MKSPVKNFELEVVVPKIKKCMQKFAKEKGSFSIYDVSDYLKSKGIVIMDERILYLMLHVEELRKEIPMASK